MSPEERIAQLEAEVARERARADGLQEIVHALTVKRRSSGAERQARYRERHAVTSSVTSDVTVTRHTPSPPLDGSPLSSKPSLPSPLSSPQPLSASQGTASPSPGGFELTSPASKKQRQPSAAERLFDTLQATRKQKCEEVGESFVEEHWPHARRNRDLKPVLEAEEVARARFEAAWGIYLADDGQRQRRPAWSLAFFMSSGVRADYETRAAREDAA